MLHQQPAEGLVVDLAPGQGLVQVPWLLLNSGSKLSEGTDRSGPGAHSTASANSNSASAHLVAQPWRLVRKVISPLC
jgi:hypothetical protein